MNKDDISKVLNNIDEKYIREAASLPGAPVRSSKTGAAHKRSFRLSWGALAACLLMTALIIPTAVLLSAEAKEYNEAVQFFEENGLPSEGLSRSELKAVYRDITTNSFTYSKTAEVIRHSVQGWEITPSEPSPDELAAAWNLNSRVTPAPQNDIGYRIDYDTVDGAEQEDICILECYTDDRVLWRAQFREFYISGYARLGDKTAVWGQNHLRSSTDILRGWIACVNDAGNILWKKNTDHSFSIEEIAAVLDNGDGTWEVVSRGDVTNLCLSRYDSEGNELSFHKTEVGNYGIRNVIRLGDEYMVQLSNTFTGDTSHLFKVDKEANILEDYSYNTDDCQYYITDTVEFGGKVFSSAYAVPLQHDEGGRHEIANILDYVFEKQTWSISSEELTPLVRDNYTAILLVCDREGGTPQTFYAVSGCMGGKLNVNADGLLEWDVESFVSTFFSPATSSFTIGGTCSVFRYTFDEAGNLADRAETDETVQYRK